MFCAIYLPIYFFVNMFIYLFIYFHFLQYTEGITARSKQLYIKRALIYIERAYKAWCTKKKGIAEKKNSRTSQFR